jgi:hypothetical protein
MILENFICLFNIVYITLFLILLFILNQFLIETNIRKKFFLFLVIFFIFMVIGLYYNLDGIIMLFVISELSVLLIFITMFSQLYSFNTKSMRINSMLFVVILFFLNYSFFNSNLIKYGNFYEFYNITLNDFYYIYNYYFEKQIFVTILIMFIITIYSIVFILFYFNIKKKSNIEHVKYKQINLLRKQNLLHQSNYSSQTRTFQK